MSAESDRCEVRVELSDGPVIAHTDEDLVRARGLPYARAARFTEAVDVRPWDEPLDGTSSGPVCVQMASRLDFVTGPLVEGLRQSEDCQVLSIAAPAAALSDGRPRPVLVWLHGGAYVSGGGEAPGYDPATLAREGDLVVVTVTYRLGIFGWLGLPDVAPANLGLTDQLAALRWVHRNIAAFGGDPQQVTLAGQSAGADSILSLLAMPESNRLFVRAVLQSAPLGIRDGREPMNAAMADAVLDAAPDAVDAPARGGDLRKMDAARLLQLQALAARAGAPFGPRAGMPFGPQAGHGPLPGEHDIPASLAQRAPAIDLMITYCRDDALPFLLLNARARRLLDVPIVGHALRAVLVRLITRRLFARPAQRLAAAWTAAGGRVSLHRIDWSPGPLGACHCVELPLLFGTPSAWNRAPMLGGSVIPDQLAATFRQAWATFAADGTPAPDQPPLRRLR